VQCRPSAWLRSVYTALCMVSVARSRKDEEWFATWCADLLTSAAESWYPDRPPQSFDAGPDRETSPKDRVLPSCAVRRSWIHEHAVQRRSGGRIR
jgi:hypothetical protein